MEGWSENEIRNKELMAPCGLYCGVCGVYIATRDKNEKFKTVMANLYGTKPEETECLGCMQPKPPKKLYVYCKLCPLRDCVISKGYYSCHHCEIWPCDKIEKFGLATGIRVMKRTIPIWRANVKDLGDQKARNGPGQNVSVITALHVENHFSGVQSVVELVEKM